ncbi:MAG: hypothetical protein ABEJ79_09580 [Halolamina sp.]
MTETRVEFSDTGKVLELYLCESCREDFSEEPVVEVERVND